MGGFLAVNREAFFGPGGFSLPSTGDNGVVRALFPTGAVATTGGILTLPTGTSALRVSGAEDFIGISLSGCYDGRIVFLTFTDARNAQHGQAVPIGSAPLSFYYIGPTLVQTITFPRYGGRLTFQYNAEVLAWQVIAGPYL